MVYLSKTGNLTDLQLYRAIGSNKQKAACAEDAGRRKHGQIKFAGELWQDHLALDLQAIDVLFRTAQTDNQLGVFGIALINLPLLDVFTFDLSHAHVRQCQLQLHEFALDHTIGKH